MPNSTSFPGDRNNNLPLTTARGSLKTIFTQLRLSSILLKPPGPTLNHELIPTDNHALVVASVAFHISECESHHEKIQSGERQNQPCTAERQSHGNCNNDQRKGSQNEEPVLPRRESYCPGRRSSLSPPFPYCCNARQRPVPNPLRHADKTKAFVFRGPKCSTWPAAIAMNIGRLNPVDNKSTMPYKV